DPGMSTALRFANPREPQQPQDLASHLQAQLVHAAKLWDGKELPLSERLAEDPDDDEASFLGLVSVWDLLDEGGVLVYEGWFYMGDSGTIFCAGTSEVV